MTTIETLEANRKVSLAPFFEIQSDRIQRYFDCQDDTLLGGVSDQVTNSSIEKINRKYDILIEQEKNGGFLKRFETSICLYRDGNMVSNKICSGRFGLFFVLLDGSFVSIAKKKTTFDKKGFEVVVLTTEYKCNFVKISNNGYVIYDNIEVCSINKRSFDFSKDNFSSSSNWIEHLRINN